MRYMAPSLRRSEALSRAASSPMKSWKAWMRTLEALGEGELGVHAGVGPGVVQVDGVVRVPMRSTRPKRWIRRTGFQCRS